MGERKNIVGEVIADVRDKLVDEAWFGRRPTEQREDPLARLGGGDEFKRQWTGGLGGEPSEPDLSASSRLPKLGARQSFEEAWALGEPAEGQTARDKEVGLDI